MFFVFCVFLCFSIFGHYFLPLLVFYVFLYFPDFFFTSVGEFNLLVSSRPCFRFNFGFFFFVIFSFVMCFMCFRVFFTYFAYIMSLLVFYVFSCFLDFFWWIRLAISISSVFYVFLRFPPFFCEICPSRGDWGEGGDGSFPHQIR